MKIQQLTITQPDDFHVHLRDGQILKETVAASARSFNRILVMPNLNPAVVTARDSLSYKQRIINALPESASLTPLMSLYLTNQTTRGDLDEAINAGVVACKLYPAGATTNSKAAVSHIEQLNPLFEYMAEIGLLLLVHGEVTGSEVDIFDREKVFIDQYLSNIIQRHPGLKVVFEHITTREAVEFVLSASNNVAATITVQHLMYNRNHLLAGGLRPHNYCLPVLKRNIHQLALKDVVRSGSSRFFLGTDSAPHEKYRKESSCGCAGCYSAWSAIELYAQIFDELDCLDKLQGFSSEFGADFYGLERNQTTLTLVRKSWKIPEIIELATGQKLVPFMAGETIHWKLQ